MKKKDFEQIKKDAKLLAGNIGSDSFKLIKIIEDLVFELEMKADTSANVYDIEGVRQYCEARAELARGLLRQIFEDYK